MSEICWQIPLEVYRTYATTYLESSRLVKRTIYNHFSALAVDSSISSDITATSYLDSYCKDVKVLSINIPHIPANEILIK